MTKAITMVGLFLTVFITAGTPKIHFHQDRGTPRVIFNPDWPVRSIDRESARHFLVGNSGLLGLGSKAENMVFLEMRESLTGKHYRFGQVLHGIQVENAETIVSFDKKTGKIFRIANTVYPVRTAVSRPARFLLNEEEALDVAWSHLRVHGGLVQDPKAKLIYLPEAGGFRLIFRVEINTDAPMGYWSLAVDALRGEVVGVHDLLASHRPRNETDFAAYQGMLTDRLLETRRLRAHLARRAEKRTKAVQTADGMGVVFDPDPRTTLADETIEDFSPAQAFEDAYRTRVLKEITFDDETGEFELIGPWAEVIVSNVRDAGPDTPPSKTMDGFWNFRRGENGFNDTMSYYHVDKNQRYIQSLGFTGPSGIQEGPTQLDTDGYHGQDNSFFNPPNILVYGHGCVDDNEDADVIIHEYGHALQYDIDTRWLGFSEDAGAMGEGFSDYWAGSHSFKTENGPLFHPEWIYSWDGHGATDDCWEGRVMDRLEAQYDPNTTYGFHAFFGTFVSDELWATPLFQAMITLFEQGIPIADADRIIMEAHFGMPGNLRMPDMAQATVNAAWMLHPNGPHAQVFQESFARNGILGHVDSYTYLAAHVPPASEGGGWISEIELTNPSTLAADVRVTVFEGEAAGIGLTNYSGGTPQSFTIEPGSSTRIDPDGTNQRWVLLESNQPLSGTSFLSRTLEGMGRERAGIPISGITDVGVSIILPHVPANRVKFWSGAVILNPGESAVDLTIRLIGENGTELDGAKATGLPTRLEPRQKWVTFLTEGPGGTPGIIDDGGLAEKVSYVILEADRPITAFQLYGYHGGGTGPVATAGIQAAPGQDRTHWPIRVALTDVDWAGFSILNPGDKTTALNVRALGRNGNVLGDTLINIGPKQKLLGLNTVEDGFSFPSNRTAAIRLPDGGEVQTVLITSDDNLRTFGVPSPLRVFDLSGDNNESEIDGGATPGLATRALFSKPRGKLELFKAEFPGTLNVVTRRPGGTDTSTFDMAPGASVQIAVPGDAVSIEITGGLFTASVIDRDTINGALTVINGKPVELITHGAE